MLYIRSLIINILFYLITAFWAIFGVVAVILPQPAIYFVAKQWSTWCLFALKICGIDHEFRGFENVPKDRPYILACKHQSAWDVFAFFQIASNVSIALKKELIYIPFFGQAVWKSRPIEIKRGAGGDALKSLIKGAKERISEGRPVLIFPEGTRRPVGAPPDYKFGISMLYSSLKVPVVPVALNSGLFWKRRSFLRYQGKVIVEILPVIEAGLPRDEFAAKLQETIENASNALIKESENAVFKGDSH